jgi:hypothetical protein
MHCLTLLKKLVVVQMQLLLATLTQRLQHRQILVTHILTMVRLACLEQHLALIVFRISQEVTQQARQQQTLHRQQLLLVLVQVAQMQTTSHTLLCTSGKERHEKP